MIFELAEDFADALAAMPAAHPKRRLLRLLDEAVRRDIHFLDRHPTTLFQCLWNTCWWYDCPEAKPHFLSVGETEMAGHALPFDGRGAKLCQWMEHWRKERERAVPGGRWLRSLRPPLRNLGSVGSTVVKGHLGHIHALCPVAHGAGLLSIDDAGGVYRWGDGQLRELWRFRAHETFFSRGRYLIVPGPTADMFATAGPESDACRLRTWAGIPPEGQAAVATETDIVALTAFDSGRRLCGGLGAGEVILWEWKSVRETARRDFGAGPAVAIHEGPGGSLLLACRHKVLLWRVEEDRVDELLSCHEAITACALHSDGSRLAVGTANGSVRVWDLSTRCEVLTEQCHGKRVTATVFAGDDLLVSAGFDGMTVFVDLAASQTVRSVRFRRDYVESLLWQQGKVFGGTFRRQIHIWDPSARALAPTLELPDPRGSLWDGAFNRRRTRLVVVARDKTISEWNARTGRLIRMASLSRMPPQPALTAVSRRFQMAWDGVETTLETRSGRVPIAWWPESLTPVRRPSDRVFGGVVDDHVVLFRVEDVTGSSPRGFFGVVVRCFRRILCRDA